MWRKVPVSIKNNKQTQIKRLEINGNDFNHYFVNNARKPAEKFLESKKSQLKQPYQTRQTS